MANLFNSKNFKNILGLWLFVGLVTILIPIMLLYGLKAAQSLENLLKFMFYALIATFSSIMISLDQATENRKIAKWFDTILHNPEKGMLSQFEIVRNPWKLFMISFIIFGIIGTFSVATNTFFAKIPGFQIVPIASIGMNAEPAASAENLLFFGVLQGLGIGISAMIARKNKALFVLLSLLTIIIVGGVLFPFYHNLYF